MSRIALCSLVVAASLAAGANPLYSQADTLPAAPPQVDSAAKPDAGATPNAATQAQGVPAPAQAMPAAQDSTAAGQSAPAGVSREYPRQNQAAPVERGAPDPAYSNGGGNGSGRYGYGRRGYIATGPGSYSANGYGAARQSQILTTHPAQGITVNSTAAVEVVTANEANPAAVANKKNPDGGKVELRVSRGTANVMVHKPARGVLIQVDLPANGVGTNSAMPGGQVVLVHDGLYTFNAANGTVSVLKGQAVAYPGGSGGGIKVKEDHRFTFGTSATKPEEMTLADMNADLLVTPAMADHSRRESFYGYYGYPYPYYAYGYPWGWGGWGYPYGFGVGLGFGYYGGWGRGFYGRGFRR